MGQTFYSEETEKIIDELILNQDIIERIEKVAFKGAKVVCIKDAYKKAPPQSDNFSDYLERRKKSYYSFKEGKTYEVERVFDDKVIIKGNIFNLLDLPNINRFNNEDKYIFNVFITEGESIANKRNEQINQILETDSIETGNTEFNF